MPCLGLMSLHILSSQQSSLKLCVSMPCLGLMSLHFQLLSAHFLESFNCVNALSRAHVSALDAQKGKDGSSEFCVNALSRAHVSAQPDEAVAALTDEGCVNALSRAHVSARNMVCASACYTYMCQCPVSGSCLCTPSKDYFLKQFYTTVSMPCLGLMSLHRNGETEHEPINTGVNALSRAHVSARQKRLPMAMQQLVSMPCLGLMSLHIKAEAKSHHKHSCQCPVSGSCLCTLPLKTPSLYAGFKPCFLVYFSELSDFWAQ